MSVEKDSVVNKMSDQAFIKQLRFFQSTARHTKPLISVENTTTPVANKIGDQALIKRFFKTASKSSKPLISVENTTTPVANKKGDQTLIKKFFKTTSKSSKPLISVKNTSGPVSDEITDKSFIKRFLNLTGQQARPLSSIKDNDPAFRAEKVRGRYSSFYKGADKLSKNKFTQELKKYFSVLKRRWQQSTIKRQEVSDGLKHVVLKSDPVFKLSDQYSNKIDDRIKLVNDVSVSKPEYIKLWLLYLDELNKRTIKLKRVLKILYNFGKDYAEKNKAKKVIDFTNDISSEVFEFNNFKVTNEDLENSFELVKDISDLGYQIVVNNVTTGKHMCINKYNYGKYLESNGGLFATSSDVFELQTDDDFLNIGDYKFFLIPLIPSTNYEAKLAIREASRAFFVPTKNAHRLRSGNVSPFAYDHNIYTIVTMFKDMQVYSFKELEMFKSDEENRKPPPPCFDYAVKRYLNYKKRLDSKNACLYDALLKTFYVNSCYRTKFGYVPLSKIKSICTYNNMIVSLIISRKYGEKRPNYVTYKPAVINEKTVTVELNYCRETEHFYANTYDPKSNKSSRFYYNSLRGTKGIYEMSKSEKLTTMGVRKFDKSKFSFERSLTTSSKRKSEKNLLIPECLTKEEFKKKLEEVKRNRKPVDYWRKMLLVPFDFETFNNDKTCYKNINGVDIVPMSVSAYFPLINKCVHWHRGRFIYKFLSYVVEYYKHCIREICREFKIEEKLAKIKYRLTLVAHNLSFDFHPLIPYLYRSKIIGTSSNIKMASGAYNGVSLSFFNSCNYFPDKLENIAKAFGVGEKEVFPYSFYNEDTSNDEYCAIDKFCASLSAEDKEHVINVCTNNSWILEGKINIIKYREYYNNLDCEILYNVIIHLWDLINETLGVDCSDCKTMGCIVIELYDKLGCFEGTCELTDELSEFIRQSLAGGRVCIKDNKPVIIENDCIVPLDINSLYPGAMVEMNGFLKGKPVKYTGEGIKWLMENSNDFFVNMRIKRVGKSLSLPFLSEKVNGVRVYSNKPIDKILVNKDMMTVYMDYHDVTYDDVEIIDGMYYNSGFNQNVSFLTDILYTLRMSLTGAAKAAIKLILNNGYGKLAQKMYDDVVVIVEGIEEVAKIYTRNPVGFSSFEPVLDSVAIDEKCEIEKLANNEPKFDKYKVKYTKDFLNSYSSYSHEAFRVLAKSKLICGRYQYCLELAGFDIVYTDTDSFHALGYTPEKYKRFLAEFKKHAGVEVSKTCLGGAKIDFEPPVNKGEKLISFPHATRGGYLRPKQYYEEVSYTVECENGEIKEKKYPHVRCKGIKTNSIINHAMDLKTGDQCDAIFDFYKNKCLVELGEKKHDKDYFTVDSCSNGGFSVMYNGSKAFARNTFKRTF